MDPPSIPDPQQQQQQQQQQQPQQPQQHIPEGKTSDFQQVKEQLQPEQGQVRKTEEDGPDASQIIAHLHELLKNADLNTLTGMAHRLCLLSISWTYLLLSLILLLPLHPSTMQRGRSENNWKRTWGQIYQRGRSW